MAKTVVSAKKPTPMKSSAPAATAPPVSKYQSDMNLALMQKEQDLTHTVLKKLRDTPNEHLSNLTHEIQNISSKLEPMLDKVELAQKNIEMARATYAGQLPSQTEQGGIGMLSKMGGRLIHYHSDDLTEMLLDDILFDTVKEL